MANQWFRMYAEFANDPKVQMLSEAMQRRLVMLFCMRCGDVTVTLSDDELAFQLRITPAELAETKALFVGKGFINTAWELLNWEKRQFASDSSAARTKAYRDRKRDAGVTSHVTKSDALDTDTDTDTDTDKKKPRKRAASKHSIPADFSISDRVRAWAVDKGHGQLDRHLEHFRLTSTAKGYTYADWDSAFMNAVAGNWAKLPTLVPALQAGGGRREL